MTCKHNNLEIVTLGKRHYKKCTDCNFFLHRKKKAIPTHVLITNGIFKNQRAEIVYHGEIDSILSTETGHYFILPNSETTPIQFKNRLI